MRGRKPALPALKVHRDGPLPSPPSWLDKLGCEAWARLAPLMGDFQESDTEAFAVLCEAWSVYRQAMEEIQSDGMFYSSITESGGEIRRKSPACEVASDAWQRFWKGCGEFGLTPVARARLKQGKANKEVDEFEAFLGEKKA